MLGGATELAPGVFMTSTPRALAARTSILSTPVPARPITFSLPASAMRSAVTSLTARRRHRVVIPKTLLDLLGATLLRGVHRDPLRRPEELQTDSGWRKRRAPLISAFWPTLPGSSNFWRNSDPVCECLICGRWAEGCLN
ncbi:MAG: hypothetical protein AB7W37_18610 [Syntrophobacteraceae bacterium]